MGGRASPSRKGPFAGREVRLQRLFGMLRSEFFLESSRGLDFFVRAFRRCIRVEV